MPDLEARRLHRVTHWPYRARCTWCVMGRGKEESHKRSTRESTLPTVGLDYCFPALKDHDPLTVLVTLVTFPPDPLWEGLCKPGEQSYHKMTRTDYALVILWQLFLQTPLGRLV